MGIFVNVAGSGERLRRLTVAAQNHNAAYTCMFSVYISSQASFANDHVWGVSGASNYSGGTQLGNRVDFLNGGSSSFWQSNVTAGNGTTLTTVGATAKPSNGTWYRLAWKRNTVANVSVRNSTTQAAMGVGNGADVTGREATAIESFFETSLHAGCGICNYKWFAEALSDANCDAESLTSEILNPTNFVCSSAMNDTVTLANNLTITHGVGNTWTAGADLIVGANDPAITFSTGIPKSTKFFLLGVG